MQENRLDTVKNEFFKYLSSLGLSSKSHKNYKSDLHHFLAWIMLRLKNYGSYIESLTDAVPFLNLNLVQEYKNYLQGLTTPVKTINRRLSTLRHLSAFLQKSGALDTGFMQNIGNIKPAGRKKSVHPLLANFKAHLESQKVSPNTIKNYLSDIKQFITWLEANERTT
jgi:site-specific recombinase XerD